MSKNIHCVRFKGSIETKFRDYVHAQMSILIYIISGECCINILKYKVEVVTSFFASSWDILFELDKKKIILKGTFIQILLIVPSTDFLVSS